MWRQEKELGKKVRRVFFDTEFTGLFDNAGLISIGLIDDTGTETFYAESTDTWRVNDCSPFCRHHVLIHLEGKPAQMKLSELRRQLRAWLEMLGPQVLLLSDSARDIDQLKRIFPRGLPDNVTARVYGPYDVLTRMVFNGDYRIHHLHGWRVHHSLDDAKANRIAYLKGRLRSVG